MPQRVLSCFMAFSTSEGVIVPWQQGSWGHLGPTGPRWAPCWPHELCYLGIAKHLHLCWTLFYFKYDPKCSTTSPWCTIDAPAVFAWCTINASVAFAWCTNHFAHKVEFSHICWDGVHPVWLGSPSTLPSQGVWSGSYVMCSPHLIMGFTCWQNN